MKEKNWDDDDPDRDVTPEDRLVAWTLVSFYAIIFGCMLIKEIIPYL